MARDVIEHVRLDRRQYPSVVGSRDGHLVDGVGLPPRGLHLVLDLSPNEGGSYGRPIIDSRAPDQASSNETD